MPPSYVVVGALVGLLLCMCILAFAVGALCWQVHSLRLDVDELKRELNNIPKYYRTP